MLFILLLTIFIITLSLIYFLYFNNKQEELSEKNSILALRKDELDAASKQWKSRIDKSDADNFSVAGRMEQIKDLQIAIPNVNSNNRKLPRPKRYKGKEG